MHANLARLRYVDPSSRLKGFSEGALSSLKGGHWGEGSPTAPLYPEESPEAVDMRCVAEDMYAAFFLHSSGHDSDVRK